MKARLVLAVAAFQVVSGLALSADQLVPGKKLLIKNPPAGAAANKLVHLGKDAGIVVVPAGGTGDPQCSGAGGGGTSSLRVIAAGGAGDVTILLPCDGWTTNRTNTLYKYKDAAGGTCKLVSVKAGVLVKAACKGTQVAVDVNGTMAPVAVVTTLNTQRYCTEFGGTAVKDGSDDKTWLHKDADAPPSCPATTTTSSTSSTTICTPNCPVCVGSPATPDGCGGFCTQNCAQPCCGTLCCSPSQSCCPFDDPPFVCLIGACP